MNMDFNLKNQFEKNLPVANKSCNKCEHRKYIQKLFQNIRSVLCDYDNNLKDKL